jgi:hypothetical protein
MRAALARADEPAEKPTEQAMLGPFPTAFDQVCEKAKARVTDVQGEAGPDDSPITCARAAQGQQKPFAAVEVYRVGNQKPRDYGEAWVDFYVSVKTDAGWFVTAAPLSVQAYFSKLTYELRLDSARVSLRQLAAGRGRAAAAAFTLSFDSVSNQGPRGHEHVHSRSQEQGFILVGVGKSGPRSLLFDGHGCKRASVTTRGGYARSRCDELGDAKGTFDP